MNPTRVNSLRFFCCFTISIPRMWSFYASRVCVFVINFTTSTATDSTSFFIEFTFWCGCISPLGISTRKTVLNNNDVQFMFGRRRWRLQWMEGVDQGKHVNLFGSFRIYHFEIIKWNSCVLCADVHSERVEFYGIFRCILFDAKNTTHDITREAQQTAK